MAVTSPLVEATPRRRLWYRHFLKRVVDVLLVVAALPFVAPLMLLLGLAVARDGHSPFYRQQRIGRFGRTFTMWKLRTMVYDADTQLELHLADNADARSEWSRKQKLKNDPRITRLGRILRKTSLDELPQIWNVLTGDMSLVGPRPMMCAQADLYPGAAYYLMRPGITGLWQISDRNESEFKSRASYDTRYAETMSLASDLWIMLRTAVVVLRGTGC